MNLLDYESDTKVATFYPSIIDFRGHKGNAKYYGPETDEYKEFDKLSNEAWEKYHDAMLLAGVNVGYTDADDRYWVSSSNVGAKLAGAFPEMDAKIRQLNEKYDIKSAEQFLRIIEDPRWAAEVKKILAVDDIEYIKANKEKLEPYFEELYIMKHYSGKSAVKVDSIKEFLKKIWAPDTIQEYIKYEKVGSNLVILLRCSGTIVSSMFWTVVVSSDLKLLESAFHDINDPEKAETSYQEFLKKAKSVVKEAIRDKVADGKTDLMKVYDEAAETYDRLVCEYGIKDPEPDIKGIVYRVYSSKKYPGIFKITVGMPGKEEYRIGFTKNPLSTIKEVAKGYEVYKKDVTEGTMSLNLLEYEVELNKIAKTNEERIDEIAKEYVGHPGKGHRKSDVFEISFVDTARGKHIPDEVIKKYLMAKGMSEAKARGLMNEAYGMDRNDECNLLEKVLEQWSEVSNIISGQNNFQLNVSLSSDEHAEFGTGKFYLKAGDERLWVLSGRFWDHVENFTVLPGRDFIKDKLMPEIIRMTGTVGGYLNKYSPEETVEKLKGVIKKSALHEATMDKEADEIKLVAPKWLNTKDQHFWDDAVRKAYEKSNIVTYASVIAIMKALMHRAGVPLIPISTKPSQVSVGHFEVLAEWCIDSAPTNDDLSEFVKLLGVSSPSNIKGEVVGSLVKVSYDVTPEMFGGYNVATEVEFTPVVAGDVHDLKCLACNTSFKVSCLPWFDDIKLKQAFMSKLDNQVCPCCNAVGCFERS